MAEGTWLKRGLFAGCLVLAAGLTAAVLLAPWLDDGAEPGEGWPRVWRLFGRDAVLRRTSLASAVGLTVTAYVFFLPAAARREGRQS
jgi:hypothetical protein